MEVSRRLIAAADAVRKRTTVPAGDGATAPRGRHARAGRAAGARGGPLSRARLAAVARPAVGAAAHAPLQNRPLDNLVAQVEAHLEKNPDDGRGWEVVAPVYMRLGRFDDAVKAWRNALRLNGASADREADLGEALMAPRTAS